MTSPKTLLRSGSRLLYWLFPAKCACCDQVIRPGHYLCPSCRQSLPHWDQPPFPDGWLDGVSCPLSYTGGVPQAISKFKFHDRRELAALFAPLMAGQGSPHWQPLCLDLVTAVPMYPAKQRRRGYNQAVLLARELSRTTGIPCREDLLRKVRDNRIQHSLSAKERQENVRGVYQVAGDVQGKRILLVDDVYTTGATMNACARVLKNAGAQLVWGAAAARALRQGEDAGR